MLDFFQSMFKGVSDDVSSKRVITFMSFLCCMFAFLCNVFISIPLEPHIFDGMLYLTGAGLGFSAFEKFSPAKHNEVTIHHKGDE